MNEFRNGNLGLGIDTGGTYTDAVMADLDTKEVIAKTKVATTYQDRSIGLLGAVDGVLQSKKFSINDIHLVGDFHHFGNQQHLARTWRFCRSHWHRMETG